MKFTKETATRALRTFIQAVIAYIAVNLVAVDFTSGKDIVKSALIGLGVSAVSAGLAAVMNLENEEKGGSDTMTFDAWVKSYLGKKIDYDNVSGVQCVDLAKHYMNKVLGLKPASFGNAKCYATDFYDYSFFKNNFELLKNTPDFIPKKGDIGVRITGTYGHIFICDGVGTTSYFYAYDQNHTGKHEPMTRRKMDYSQLQYVLRPKDQSNIVSKVNKPKVKQWELYTMKTQAYCYKDKNAKDIYTVKEILKINPAVKSLLVSTKSTDKARYKLNVKVTCKSIHEHNGDVIIKTPTCYVKVYSYSKDKSYI